MGKGEKLFKRDVQIKPRIAFWMPNGGRISAAKAKGVSSALWKGP